VNGMVAPSSASAAEQSIGAIDIAPHTSTNCNTEATMGRAGGSYKLDESGKKTRQEVVTPPKSAQKPIKPTKAAQTAKEA